MNVDELQAGRELDAMVAEKVFGREPEHLFTDEEGFERVYEPDDAPEYSTNIFAAWLVVEKLRTNHMMLSVSWGDEGGWWCVIYPRQGMPFEGPYAETAPLAICRAAMLTVQP